MAIKRGPSIVKDGLVLCLDAADKNSYPGAGTTWYDLSGNGYNATLVGSPVWDGSKFIFPDGQIITYAILPIAALNNLTSGIIYSLELVTVIDNTNGEYFFSGATTSNNNYFIMFKSTAISPNSGTFVSGVNPPISAGETINLSIVNNSGTVSFYKNGLLSCVYSGGQFTNNLKLTEGWVLNQEQDSVLGGFDPGQACAMKTSIVRLYDRVLSASEIFQNYNVTKSRFLLT